MKANKAPEKIYVKPLLMEDGESVLRRCTFERQDENQIEYTRTDAFVEKACDWLEKHTLYAFDLDFGHSLQMKHFIEDFKKYMRGE